MGLTILRDQVLREKRFDYAFRTYIKRWSFKHPTPWDFFHTMDNVAGEDLTWFWNEWFLTTWKLDQSAKDISYIDNDPAKGALITIENLEGMAMPATILIKEDNGKTGTVKLPAEIWQRGGTWTFHYNSASKITYITLDPEHVLPDVNPDNNSLAGVEISKGVTAKSVIKAYFDAIGGEEKVKDIKDLTINSEGVIQGFNVVRVNKFKTPNKFYQDITVPAFNNFSVSHILMDGDSLNLKQNGRSVTLSGKEERGAVKARYKLFPELDFNSSGYTMVLDSAIKVVNGHLAYLITVTGPDGIRVKYFYDQQSGLKIKQYTDVQNSTKMEFDDYRDINTGVKIPFTEKNAINGEPIDYKIKSATANTGLPNDTFK
jgi:hypothetical protein